MVNREVRNTRATAKAGAAGVIRRSNTRDTFGLLTISKWTATAKYTAYLESTVTCTTLSGRKGVSALPVIEIEAAITAEGACREAGPVKAARLLTTAVVIRVARALEARSIKIGRASCRGRV